MIATTIPVTITEEAARRVAFLGMQSELDSMIEWTRGNVHKLHAIVVVPGAIRGGIHANLVVINAHCTFDEETLAAVPVEWDWAGWKAQTFPPRVCSKFIMSCTSQPVPLPSPSMTLLQ